MVAWAFDCSGRLFKQYIDGLYDPRATEIVRYGGEQKAWTCVANANQQGPLADGPKMSGLATPLQPPE